MSIAKDVFVIGLQRSPNRRFDGKNTSRENVPFHNRTNYVSSGGIMLLVLQAHSIVRWLIVIIGVLTVIKFAIGWFGNRSFDNTDRGLSSGYSGLMDLQALLGLTYFLWSGFAGAGFPRFRWEHMGVMLVAVAVAHLPSMRKKATGRAKYVNGLIAVLGSLLLIGLGVSLLPGGWSRPFPG
jgi:uncharacterized membrane protein YecN with MAPEG domain